MDKRKLAKWLCALCLIAAILSGGVLWAWWKWTEWGFRRELPASATDIHEWAWEDGFLPDYEYMLKAKVTDVEFLEYVQKFGLTPHSPSRRYLDSSMWLDWKSSLRFDGDWWTPSDSLDETFVWQGGTGWTFAKYQDGYLFLKSLIH